MVEKMQERQTKTCKCPPSLHQKHKQNVKGTRKIKLTTEKEKN